MAMELGNNRFIRRAVLAAKMRLNGRPRLKRAVSTARFRLWQMAVRRRSAGTDPAFRTDRTCWADPASIQYACADSYGGLVARKYARRGAIADGDWDRLGLRFDQTDVYRSFHEHFVQGRAWHQTELYRRVMDEISQGHVRYGCKNSGQYEAKCRALDAMFEHIRRSGYRAQAGIARDEEDLYKAEDEISVCVGRHGDLLFEDGRHRLAMAKILGLPRVPIKITMVHKQWHRFRMEVLDYARSHGGRVYQGIGHADLADVPHAYGQRRFQIIREHLPVRGGALLDIGAHWGYFCHRFEELGFACQAVESSVKNAYFLGKLRRAGNKRFGIHCGSIFDYEPPGPFAVVLALSVFHHFIKEKGSYQELVEFLRRLRTDVLVFEPHDPGEAQMAGAHRNFDNDGFVRFVIDNSCLRTAERIGQAEDGRPLYLLRR
jgi:hypothetical protein